MQFIADINTPLLCSDQKWNALSRPTKDAWPRPHSEVATYGCVLVHPERTPFQLTSTEKQQEVTSKMDSHTQEAHRLISIWSTVCQLHVWTVFPAKVSSGCL